MDGIWQEVKAKYLEAHTFSAHHQVKTLTAEELIKEGYSKYLPPDKEQDSCTRQKRQDIR